MKLGVTLLFKDENVENIKGVLKSTVIDSTFNNLKNSTANIGCKIANDYNYSYFGINDLFVVSGEPKTGEFLGRTTFYDLDNKIKSTSLVTSKFSTTGFSLSKTYNCSIIYFCENFDNEKYTISVLTVVNSLNGEIFNIINEIANSSSFIDKVKSNSLEGLKSIDFMGIEEVNEIDLKHNVFQSFYSDFNNEEELKEELLSNEEIKEIAEDIALTI